MELKDFVAESIKQIIDGVNHAKEYADMNGARVNPARQVRSSNDTTQRRDSVDGSSIETINFDVAVKAEEGTKTQGGVGVFIGVVNFGSTGASESVSSSLSRLRFSVPVALPSTSNPSKRSS